MNGVKIYGELRTAHIEQSPQVGPAEYEYFYRRRSYDFHADVIAGIATRQLGFLSTILELFRHKFDVVELHEPMYLRELPYTLIYMLAIRVRDLIRRRSTRLVTYAIENADLREKVAAHLAFLPGFWWIIAKFLTARCISSFDAIAFGTEASMNAYFKYFEKAVHNVRHREFTPFEPACQTCRIQKSPASVVFLGAFEHRKGIDLVMDLWPEIARGVSGARLTIIGMGALQLEVERWCSVHSDVTLVLDPPRPVIHQHLSSAEFLVLLSRSDSRWVEQVGLPIVEGLSHGCRIITTSGTGVSEDLRRIGHLVLEEDDITAEKISNYMRVNSSVEHFLESLPNIGGRAEAEYWLWTGLSSAGPPRVC